MLIANYTFCHFWVQLVWSLYAPGSPHAQSSWGSFGGAISSTYLNDIGVLLNANIGNGESRYSGKISGSAMS
jgi:hypothetical protein